MITSAYNLALLSFSSVFCLSHLDISVLGTLPEKNGNKSFIGHEVVAMTVMAAPASKEEEQEAEVVEAVAVEWGGVVVVVEAAEEEEEKKKKKEKTLLEKNCFGAYR